MTRIWWMAGIAIATTAGSAHAQESHRPEDARDLAFMTGCWEGSASEGTIEERWTPAANLMLGTTRYVVNGRVTGFEFAVISGEGGDISMTPYPEGVRSEHSFRLASGVGERAVFEAPEHDFPKRILYATAPGDSLRVRIDGGEGSDQASEWRLGRVDCDRR